MYVCVWVCERRLSKDWRDEHTQSQKKTKEKGRAEKVTRWATNTLNFHGADIRRKKITSQSDEWLIKASEMLLQ